MVPASPAALALFRLLLIPAPPPLSSQCNDNQLESWKEIDSELAKCGKLKCVYLERNPLAKESAYRRKLKLALPSLEQIDATLCR